MKTWLLALALVGSAVPAFAQIYCPGCSDDLKRNTPGIQWQNPPPPPPSVSDYYRPYPSVAPEMPTYSIPQNRSDPYRYRSPGANPY